MTSHSLARKYAWKRKFDAPSPQPIQPIKITPKLIVEMLPVLGRILKLEKNLKKQGRRPFFDAVKSSYPVIPVHGVPLGGLGGGTITRGWRGDFTRWQMHPGIYLYHTVDADQFSVRVARKNEKIQALVLNSAKPEGDYLQSWHWGLDPARASYEALFPRAWTVYEEPVSGVRLTCKQVSPFIPGNYQESSYPVSVFVWKIENTGSIEAEISLMFTFQNGIGTDNDRKGGYGNHLVRQKVQGGEIIEVDLAHTLRMPKPLEKRQTLAEQHEFEDSLTLAIAALANRDVKVSYRTRFLTTSQGLDVWADFETDGELDNYENDKASSSGAAIGAALAAKVCVPAGHKREIVFALAWDIPKARFGLGTAWYRRYTKFMGNDGKAAPNLIKVALTGWQGWDKAIKKWQKPILEDPSLPDWYKSMLFNETYYLVDGGTIWTNGRVEDEMDEAQYLPEPEIGHFGYLESHGYRMLNTYDVHFYASFALAKLFPELDLSLQRDFANSVFVEHPGEVHFFLSGARGPRKICGAVPHDLGAPTEDPWRLVNAYNAQDVSRWKDLNAKFVLQVMRDYSLTHDKQFLVEVWPAVKQAVGYLQQFDRDGDGMIENEGFPDQTYDAWTARGPSAYSGGLWLACLKSASKLAMLMGEKDLALDYLKRYEMGQRVFEDQLWNGSYYNYESSNSRHKDSIMADQLAGHWYAIACGLGGIVPDKHARSALEKTYVLNVNGYQEKTLGAMNGMRPDGQVDRTCTQSSEIWSGTTFAVAAAMLQAGIIKEAFTTARGIYEMVYEKFGLWFQTPEALSVDNTVRAISYMRPLAIWAIQQAWEERTNKQDQSATILSS
jgi:non-lysosomal glucosylceramidase